MDKQKLIKTMMLGAGFFAGFKAISLLNRKAIDVAFDNFTKRIMEDPYDENIWELISSSSRIDPQIIVETNLRSTEGKVINRPLGSPKNFPNLQELMFNIAQFHTMPTPLEQRIDTKVTIGKMAKKPFTVEMPIIIAPMAYGLALSKKAKISLAKGAAMAGTAASTGEGPFLEEERKEAKYLIYQYNRGDWGKTQEIIEQCDAVEIQIGQGASGGIGHSLKAKEIDKEFRNALEYPKGKDLIAHSRQPEVQKPEDLASLVIKLKSMGRGIPIGVKLAAGKYLEADLECVCNAGIDFISLEGAEAATAESAPILQDDFGVPLIFAIYRARNWLLKHNFVNQVSLIAAGKIRTPGDMLKVCALGADASYIGAIAIFALSHTQGLKALPFEPPNQVIWYGGNRSHKFKVNEGAKSLCRFLIACKEEIDDGIKALGKRGLKEVNREDLMSISELVSRGCNIPMVYESFLPQKDKLH